MQKEGVAKAGIFTVHNPRGSRDSKAPHSSVYMLKDWLGITIEGLAYIYTSLHFIVLLPIKYTCDRLMPVKFSGEAWWTPLQCVSVEWGG